MFLKWLQNTVHANRTSAIKIDGVGYGGVCLVERVCWAQTHYLKVRECIRQYAMRKGAAVVRVCQKQLLMSYEGKIAGNSLGRSSLFAIFQGFPLLI